MTTSYPTLIARLTLFAVLVVPAVSVFGQVPAGGSSARDIPTAVQQSEEQVSRVIATAEVHFRQGKLNLEDNKRDQARDEFDKAVDSVLESGLDVRASQRLQGFYLELVERIYREEVPLGRSPVQANVSELVAQNGKPPHHSKQSRRKLDFANRSLSHRSLISTVSLFLMRTRLMSLKPMYWRLSKRSRTSILLSQPIR